MKRLLFLFLILCSTFMVYADDGNISVKIDQEVLKQTEGNFQKVDEGFKQLNTDFKFFVNVAFAALAVWVGVLYAKAETDENINFARRMAGLLIMTYLVHAYGDILVDAAVSFAMDFLFPPIT